MYSKPVRGENAEGCQSFMPGAAGQISRTIVPVPGCLTGFGIGRPDLKSKPV